MSIISETFHNPYQAAASVIAEIRSLTGAVIPDKEVVDLVTAVEKTFSKDSKLAAGVRRSGQVGFRALTVATRKIAASRLRGRDRGAYTKLPKNYREGEFDPEIATASGDVTFRVKAETQNMAALYTFSSDKSAICHDLPLDQAMKHLRAFLEEATPKN